MLGYRSRAWLVRAEHDRRVLPGGGMLRAVILSRGVGAGTWRYGGRGLEVDWFGRPGAARALRAEAADVARFLGLPPP